MNEDATPHDGAQSQLDDTAAADDTATADAGTGRRGSPLVPVAPPVPVAPAPTGDTTGLGTSPPGVQAGSRRQPAIAVPGKPEGEVDTRR